MKVVIYSHFFAPVIGGAESYAMLLATGLSTPLDAAIENATQVTVVTESAANGYNDSSLPFCVVRRPRLPELFNRLRHADIVHLVGPCILPMLIAWMVRKPFVVEQHGYQVVCPNGLLLIEPAKRICPGHFMAGHHGQCFKCNGGEGVVRSLTMWLLTFFRRWLCAQAKANIAITDHVQKRLQLANSLRIYYGIPDLLADTSKAPSAVPRFAYIGRLVSEKGIGILFDAATILKKNSVQFQLKIIGDGPERETLQHMATSANLGDSVLFTGFQAGDALRRVMADVSVVVMPSQWEETAGLSAMEQMMRGRLVICSDIGGLGEIVDGAGLKFLVGDAIRLAELMRQVAENPKVIEQWGEKARERALRLFTLDRMVADHVKLYRSLVTAKPTRSEAAAEIQ